MVADESERIKPLQGVQVDTPVCVVDGVGVGQKLTGPEFGRLVYFVLLWAEIEPVNQVMSFGKFNNSFGSA